MEKRPTKKDAYDWRNGVCTSCGVEAVNRCCEQHEMVCFMCKGFGAISKLQWENIYREISERRVKPPNECCDKCDAHFNHSVGSHSDDRDHTPCQCLKGQCDWVFCECHYRSKEL